MTGPDVYSVAAIGHGAMGSWKLMGGIADMDSKPMNGSPAGRGMDKIGGGGGGKGLA